MADKSESLTELMDADLVPIEAGPRREVSPMNFIGWRYIVRALGLALLAAVADLFFKDVPVVGTWLQSVFAAGAWYHAVKFLLLAVKARRIWTILLLIAALGVLISPWFYSGYLGAMTITVVFLVFRRYRTYRFLTSRRRALIWVFCLVTLTLLLIRRELTFLGHEAWHVQLWRNVINYSIHVFRLFLVFSLLSIFLHMRLHFMRLKPKLAMSVVFLSLVPLLLVGLFAVVGAWSLLGESRAHRGRAIIHDWMASHDAGEPLDQIPWGDRIDHRRGDDTDEGPDWLPRFLSLVAAGASPPDSSANEIEQAPIEFESAGGNDYNFTVHPPSRSWEEQYWTPADTTILLNVDSELWLLKLTGVGDGAPGVSGYRFSAETMDHISSLLSADAIISLGLGGNLTTDEEGEITAAAVDSSLHIFGKMPRPAAADSATGLTEKGQWFGIVTLETVRPHDDYFARGSSVLHLSLRPADLRREMFDADDQIGRAIMYGMLIFAGLLLVVMLAAIFFGTRITGGITAAVKALHRNTVKLAKGDLSAAVDIPNEDEFGDLADAFNDMTLAIKRGRREAIHRERLERELLMARSIQERLFPEADPSLAGFEITGTSLPSRQVGGDYFDFLGLGEGRTGIAIGDVSGKGVPAALLMSNLQASLQGQVIHPSTVCEVVERVNDLLVRSTDDNMFATFVYCLLDSRSANLTITNAGHNPPILYRKNGSVMMLETGGLILGMLPNMSYKQETVHMEPGDVLILFTDGITEAEVTADDELDVAASPAATTPSAADGAADDVETLADENMFGEERLLRVLKANAHLPALGIREAILKEVNEFTRGSAQSDDITLVVIKRQELPA